MEKKDNQNISRVMEVLKKKFEYKERTTLNSMRLAPDAFKILIACLLSLRAKDETTEKISKELFKIADTPEKLVAMKIPELEKIIFSTGHYHKKAVALQSVSKELIERFHSRVPNTKEELMSIKHIGPKTANIVLNFAFGKQVIPVDVHCHRIPNRLGWLKTKNPEETEKVLEQILPKQYWMEFNAIFVLFGKTICVPVSPLCSQCPVEKYCCKIGVDKSR
jgi:endonuclease III